ncbi:hypothetical protein [Bradyrhizobium sp. RT5a]
MSGKDEKTPIEALGPPSNRKIPRAEALSQELWHAAARDVRHRYAAGQL